jgi:palmitoyltransferase
MNCGRLINPHFVGVVCFIVFNYFVFVYEYMISLKPAPYIVLLVVFNLLFVLLLVSMGKAILGDPGRVPIYWGFFAEESENRKRRYCLLCHSFKPER